MKKRKKKVSSIQQQKLNLARHKNEYFHRLSGMLCKFGLSHVFKSLTPQHRENIYKARVQAIRIVAAAGCVVPDMVFDIARDVVSYYHKQTMLSVLPDDQLQISLYDYFTLYLGFALCIDPFAPATNEKDRMIKEAMKPYFDYFETAHNKAATSLSSSMVALNLFTSDLRHHLFIHNHLTVTKYKGKIGMMTLCEVYSEVPEKRNFIIDGISRPAIRVGWGIYQPAIAFDYPRLTPEQLKINFRSKDLQMPVFIQSHAIQRLIERLDSVLLGMIFWFLFKSLANDVSVQRDRHGNILITMILGFHKVGYLVADIIDSSVVIRTFLFLTQTGTPEGEKLAAITGLGKVDKSYLEIDKLSTFMESDIHENEKLKNLFIEAGCESLFMLDRGVFSSPLSSGETPKADKILEYLGLNRTSDEEEDYAEYDTEENSELSNETITES